MVEISKDEDEIYLRAMVSMVAEQCGLADCVEQMIEQVRNGEIEIVETVINGKSGFRSEGGR